ncbi:hypothetical protein SNEBB_006398 [Seison nebaliae]|nr:hypothetical protein SNEBB_006398 [Seison nebaliae]
MNTILKLDSFSSTDHYEIDEKLFPYLSIEQKGYGGLTNKGKKCPNLNQCSSNTIGSCLIITLTPNTKVDIPPTLPGKYLAMELLKANEKFLSKDLRKLLKPNYLEYFIGLIGYSSESVRDNEKILFANSTNSSNVLSTEHLHKTYYILKKIIL